MTSSYVVSPKAEDDLDLIAEFISRDSAVHAVQFIDELTARFSRIAERPFSFPAKDELIEGIRADRYGNYFIFFIVMDENVLIVRIIHAAI